MSFTKTRWTGLGLATWLLVVLLTGCGTTANPTTNITPAAATSNDTLVVYSGRSEALLNPVIAAFEKANPTIKVQLKAGKNNELAAAILEEQANPQADVFITTDMLTTINLATQQALMPYQIPGTDAIPSEYKAADATWTSVTARARVIMYNRDLVQADEVPTTIQGLTDPKWKGKIAAANSSNGSFQAQVAVMKQLLGDTQTTAWLAGLIANEAQFFGSHSDVRKAIGSGEFALGLVNHYYYELQAREDSDNNVGVVYPDQGVNEMGVVINTTAVGIINNAPHPKAAELFSAFLFLPTTQALFAELNYEYPLIPGVATVPGLTPLENLKKAQIDMLAIAENVPDAVKMMQSAGIP
ncbi:MAG: extracellular solute-binding protein [Chloroflexi bacterium]|nr:MAG: extracellular solute-binding protein [Chloroflexota bacterium]